MPDTSDSRNGLKNCARYIAADIIGITVVAAALPSLAEAVEIMYGMPTPFEKPMSAEPAIVPTQPPTKASRQ